MKKIRRYDLDGLTVDIPIHYDEASKIFIEDYPDFIEAPLWTPTGHRVLFSGTDACPMAEENSPGGCPDCGSCKYFKRAAAGTWFGMCTNKKSLVNHHPDRRLNK